MGSALFYVYSIYSGTFYVLLVIYDVFDNSEVFINNIFFFTKLYFNNFLNYMDNFPKIRIPKYSP